MAQRNNRNQKNSFMSGVINYIWLCVIAGALLAFININGGSSENLIDKVFVTSSKVGAWYKKCSDSNLKDCRLGDITSKEQSKEETNVDNSIDTSSTNQNNLKTDLTNKLNSLNVVPEYKKVPYKRTEWNHWININGSSCWTIREEALFVQAEKNSIVLLDKDNKETKDKNDACSIKSGKWKDPYTNEIISNPSKTDVDHTSALSATARAGGQSWDKAKKEAFANDLDHLIVTSQKANRQKGDKTPSEWLPENKKSWCMYAKIYINILHKYNLNVSQKDKDTLMNIINTCKF